MNKKSFLAIIPARGGSKGIPRKNIIDVGGKPLIAWSIETALNSKYITKTVVSSEDDEILETALNYNASIIKRPPDLALDTSDSESVILDVIHQLEKMNEFFDYIILLQPTSPLRTTQDIDQAIDLFLNSHADSLISVYKLETSPFKGFILNNDGYLDRLFKDIKAIKRRQELQDVFIVNGAIYIIKTDKFKADINLYPDKTIPFFMDQSRSVDIDTLEDLTKINNILMALK